MLKVSYAGGTNIFIKGQGFEENPQSNLVILYSRDFSTELTAPLLNEDDAF